MPSETTSRSPLLMNRNETALLVVDLQERLLPVQPDAPRVVWNARRLIDGAKALGVTVAVTEQVPDKLGPTTALLAERLPPPHTKTAFSSAACQDLISAWHDAGVRHVVLTGIETHVCVAQTALDLLAAGFEPKVAIDAVGSRHSIDHETALRRLDASGVTLTTTEAVLFEWCETSADPAFRAISALAKERREA
ncbi:putative isochorismatase [Botrimarina colliarenosi]|uniref:Putative isochorismatase n=1 Tax=Botrimarina colliarenosi TaxID=2528001 RepID=A0A5C6A989_9BACT|nr:isochorismatase family protein [Botrimarina colliarenosi]TWT96109.1 putative isochorismatase [Botrimarina colliarenosi]